MAFSTARQAWLRKLRVVEEKLLCVLLASFASMKPVSSKHWKVNPWIHTSYVWNERPFPGLWTSRARSIQRKLESIGSQWSGGQNWIRRWLCVWYLLLQLSAIHQVWDSASPLYSKYDYDDKQLLMDRTWKLPILPKSFLVWYHFRPSESFKCFKVDK